MRSTGSSSRCYTSYVGNCIQSKRQNEVLKTNMIVLCDAILSESMIKGEIVAPFLEEFGEQHYIEYMTGSGNLACNVKISLQISLNSAVQPKYYMTLTLIKIQMEFNTICLFEEIYFQKETLALDLLMEQLNGRTRFSK